MKLENVNELFHHFIFPTAKHKAVFFISFSFNHNSLLDHGNKVVILLRVYKLYSPSTFLSMTLKCAIVLRNIKYKKMPNLEERTLQENQGNIHADTNMSSKLFF